ncbi:MAG: hypothetical protein WCD18_20155 [Thermosynechococcaceae cyanobacterium]
MLNFRSWLQPFSPKRRKSRRPSVWVLLLLLFGLSSFCGWTLAQVQSSLAMPSLQAQAVPAPTGTVDAVPADLQLAQEIYLARCATCHIGVPPAVLPSESWLNILRDDNHYGVPWQPLRNPDLALTWKYARTFSRPLNPNEQAPYRVEKSRYFKILHPRVKFTEPVTLNTCASCHIGAKQFNFRELSPQWQDGP